MKAPLACAAVLVCAALAPAPVGAQGTMSGSTKVAGPPDSAFSSFLAFLQTQGASVIHTDSAHHQVEAKVKGSDESVLFVFSKSGDSTAVNAQGTKGGVAAMIFGLGTVNDWLEQRRGLKR